MDPLGRPLPPLVGSSSRAPSGRNGGSGESPPSGAPAPRPSSGPPPSAAAAAQQQQPALRSEGSTRRGAKRNKVHSSKYKVRKHGPSTLVSTSHWEGQEEEPHNPLESGAEDEGGSRRHRRRGTKQQQGDAEGDLGAARKHPSKTIIGKLGMTAGLFLHRNVQMFLVCLLWIVQLLSFLPKALWKQFHRLPNWWLVAVLILEFIPLPRFHALSPWSTFIPLALTLGICLIKELLLDLQRRATDRWRNFRVCTIIDGRRPQLRLVHWESLRVGNIVRLTDDEEVPADVVVLATSNPEGIAYVETSKLDGETTLKFKQGVKETRTETYPLAIAGIRGRVVCEKPTSSMDQFTGSLKLDAHPRATSLDLSNFIHRGSHIRNTEWVYGVVVYTGHDTRSLRCAKHPSLKFAHIESEVNSYTLVSFFIIALLILISVMSKSSVQDRERVNNVRTEFPSSVSFLLGSTEALQNPWLAILRYLALFLAVIPVSLPFVLDCAYCIQAWLIQGDAAMTVGAPQQPLGSGVAFGFGGSHGDRGAPATQLSGKGGELGSSTGGGGEAFNDSTGGETSVGGQEKKVPPADAAAASNNGAAEKDPETERSRAPTASSPTMRSFAEAKGDSTWPSVHTPNIIPDLGQVDFVFIDKTGTLTGNDMTFSMCSVVGRIYGMKDSRGAWQSRECKTNSDLLDAAMIEQLRAARADSHSSSTRRQPAARGLWTTGHGPHARGIAAHRASLQEGAPGGGPFNPAFSTAGLHGRGPPLGSSSPSPESNRSPLSSELPEVSSSSFTAGSSPTSGRASPYSVRWDSGPLNCIRSLEDNSPRAREQLVGSPTGVDRGPIDSPPSSVSPVQVDDALPGPSPRQTKKTIAFAVGERKLQESAGGVAACRRVATLSSSESSSFQGVHESPSEAAREEGGHSDDSFDSTSKKEEKLRVPFLYDNITPPTRFRGRTHHRGDLFEKKATFVKTFSSLHFQGFARYGKGFSSVSKGFSFKVCSSCAFYHLHADTPADGQIRRNCDFYDMQIFEDLANADERSHRVNEFLKCMALCNTVVPHLKGPVGGGEVLLPSSAVQSWVASAAPHSAASALARTIGTTAPISMLGQRGTTRASVVALRDTATKLGDERGPPSGGNLWQFPSNPFAQSAAHRSASLEANGVAENGPVPQAVLPRGDSCDSNPSPEIMRKATKRRKSLGRGVSFKDTHEEYSFLKDADETLADESSHSFTGLGMPSKASGDFHSMARSSSPKFVSHKQAMPPPPRVLIRQLACMSHSDASRVLRCIKYQASSPDEECMVSAASHMGYSLAARDPSSVVLQINGQSRRWQVIGVNEFTSKRGRMSVVLRPAGWSEGAVMYAKGKLFHVLFKGYVHLSVLGAGADAAMLPLLSSFEGMSHEDTVGTKYEGGMDTSFDESASAKNSPRGMQNGSSRSFARRITRDPENSSRAGRSGTLTYDTFHEAYHNLYKYSNQRGMSLKSGRGASAGGRTEADAKLVEQHLKVFSLQGLRTMEQFERDLEYLGITGVRDKLQAYVPETLGLMMEAGVRVWIATGDDVEYTLHICHSCRLLTSQTKVFHAALATRGKRAKREGILLYEMFRDARILKKADEHICLVVTGPNLAAFLNHPDLQTCFLNMACCCDVVVAARVTPTQKADMVRLVKKRLTPQPITLAIGDGGNDVPMLQEASVGVAIRTVRGTSVAGFADFAISEFRSIYLRISHQLIF
ncbi:hypothetical protein ACSSS7_003465 [Eimeria intestinalis]